MEPQHNSYHQHLTLAQTLSLLERTLHPDTIQQAQRQINNQQNNPLFISNLLQLASNLQIQLQCRQACLVAVKNIVSNYYNKRDRLQFSKNNEREDNQSEMQGQRTDKSDSKQIMSMIRKNILAIGYKSERILGLLVSKIMVIMVTKDRIKDLGFFKMKGNNMKTLHQQYTYLYILTDICQYYNNSITQSKTLNTILLKHYKPILQILNNCITNLTNSSDPQTNKNNLQCITKILQIIAYSINPNFCVGLLQYVEEILMVVLVVVGIGVKVWGTEGEYREDIYLMMDLSLGVIAGVYKWAYSNSVSNQATTARLCHRLLDGQYSKHVISIIGNILQQPPSASTTNNNPPQLYSTICKCLYSLATASSQIKQLIVTNSITILTRLLSLYSLSDDQEDIVISEIEDSRTGLMQLLGLLMGEGVGSVIVTQILDAAKITNHNTASNIQLPLFIMSQHQQYFIQYLPTLIQNPIAAIITNSNPSYLQLLLKVRSCQVISTALRYLPNQHIKQVFHALILDITSLFDQILFFMQSSQNKNAYLLDNQTETALSQLELLIIMGNIIKSQCSTGYGDKYIQMMSRIKLVAQVAAKQTSNNILTQYNQIISVYYQLVQCTPITQIPAIISIIIPWLVPIYCQQLLQISQNQQQQPSSQKQQKYISIKPVHQLYCNIIHYLLQQNNKYLLSSNFGESFKFAVGLLMELTSQDMINLIKKIIDRINSASVSVVQNYLIVVGETLYTLGRGFVVSQENQHVCMNRIQHILQLCYTITSHTYPHNPTTIQHTYNKSENQPEQHDFVFDSDIQLVVDQEQVKLSQNVNIYQQQQVEMNMVNISDSIGSVVLSVIGNIVVILSITHKQHSEHYQQIEQLYLKILIGPQSTSTTIKQKMVSAHILILMAIQNILTKDTALLLVNKLDITNDTINQLLLCCIVLGNHEIIQYMDLDMFVRVIGESLVWGPTGGSWVAQCTCVVLSYLSKNKVGLMNTEHIIRIRNRLTKYFQQSKHPQQQTTTNQQYHPLVLSLTHTPITKTLTIQNKSLKPNKQQYHEITLVEIQEIIDRQTHWKKLEIEYGHLVGIFCG